MSIDREPIKLHVGCGKRNIPGWTHVDTQPHPHVDIVTQAHHLHTVEDNSCSILYASHILEYYDWREAQLLVLPEWYRVLMPGGILRLAVPDFERICKLYLAGLSLEFFIGPIFGRIPSNQGYLYHKAAYDEERLTSLLQEAGFTDIRRYDWKTTEHAHIDDCSKGYIPHMDDRGILLSLNMECIKDERMV